MERHQPLKRMPDLGTAADRKLSENQALMILQYWARKGREVNVEVVELDGDGLGPRFVVKSNLVGGKPPS
jgi:hypothetical protein